MPADHAPMLLMTPGPTRVPERVLRAGARPMVHHRSREFSTELAELLELIGPIFGAAHPILPVHTTGRGAMEAAICNLFAPGDAIVVCCNGKFGEMWARLSDVYGLVVHRISTDWAQGVDAADVDAALAGNPNARAVALTYCDTSTGVNNDVEAVCRIAAARGALVLVDGVSALGGMPFAFDEWQVDVAVTASQKCLMSSPGLSFVAMSDRAWAASERSRLPRAYWDFREIRREISKAQPATPGTPPVHVVLQVAEALRSIHEEGFGRVIHRHSTMSLRVRAAIAALGLSLQCPALPAFSTTVTAVAAPADLSARAIRDGLEARGILVAAGLGHHEDTAFRIGHMGDIRPADVERTVAALSDVLADLRSDPKLAPR